ncbi:hypothetical protein NMG60_11003820 [Bertholletia excelsa]
MNSIFLPSSLLLRPPSYPRHSAVSLPPPRQFNSNLSNRLLSPYSCSSQHRPFSAGAASPSADGAVSVINFEDLVEKDWSFLDSNGDNSDDGIISAGEIGEASRVLVSTSSEGFVDRLMDSSPPLELLLVVHDSLMVLACVKEKHDKVKCWQGELIYVPEKWAPFDIVFLYSLPALPFKLDQVFGALAKRCSPGARIVISHPQGREMLEQQRQEFPDVVISDLPDKTTLQNVAVNHLFRMTKFVDEPGFYLAVLKFKD